MFIDKFQTIIKTNFENHLIYCRMNKTGIACIFLLISSISFGQSHYKVIRDNKTDFKSEFIINQDSTCY